MAILNGVNMDSVRTVIGALIYGEGETVTEQEAINAKIADTIIPMNHNFFNPINNPNNKYDTFIEYLIEFDDMINADQPAYNASVMQNLIATIRLRFIGLQGETLAHMLRYHYTRTDVDQLWYNACNGKLLDYLGNITCHVIDYFGANSALAWDVRLRVRYTESYSLEQNALTDVTLAPGSVN